MAASLSGPAAVKARQAHMKALGAAGKALVDQLRSGKPDQAVVKLQAAKIDAAAKELPTWFPAGSGVEAGVKTASLPVIWSDPAGFALVARQLTEAADKLDVAAARVDMSGVREAAGGVDHACKACHDKFRAKKKG
ncbi:MAG: c-type cytochrome [Caulobacteraceae bacterium]